MEKEFPLVWVGTNSDDVCGIFVLRQDGHKWRLQAKGGPPHASYLVDTGDFVLACVEVDRYQEQAGGAVVSCRLREERIEVCGTQAGLAAGLCHIAYAPRHQWVFSASYTQGKVEMLKLLETGELIPLRQVSRQRAENLEDKKSHAHCCLVSKEEEILYVCDLGTDEIARYSLPALNPLESFFLPAQSGPRHALLSSTEKYLYVACELSNVLLVLDAKNGRILQSFPCMKPDGGFCALSSIRFTDSKKMLLIGSRGQNGVWHCTVRQDEQLSPPSFMPVKKKWPWDVVPYSKEQSMLIAFEQSDCIQLITNQAQIKYCEKMEYKISHPTCLLLREYEGGLRYKKTV